jgi:hypothetical protein
MPPKFDNGALKNSNIIGVFVRSPLDPSAIPVLEEPKTPLRPVYVAPAKVDVNEVVILMALKVFVPAS